jgi:hypothetical protein
MYHMTERIDCALAGDMAYYHARLSRWSTLNHVKITHQRRLLVSASTTSLSVEIRLSTIAFIKYYF